MIWQTSFLICFIAVLMFIFLFNSRDSPPTFHFPPLPPPTTNKKRGWNKVPRLPEQYHVYRYRSSTFTGAIPPSSTRRKQSRNKPINNFCRHILFALIPNLLRKIKIIFFIFTNNVSLRGNSTLKDVNNSSKRRRVAPQRYNEKYQ